MLETLSIGDHVFVHRNIEDTGLPGDIVERVGQVVEVIGGPPVPHFVNDPGVLVDYPKGYLHKPSGHWVTEALYIKYETRGNPYTLKRVKLIDGGFHAGPNGGQMIPPARLININAARYDKSRNLCHRKWPDLWADIQENGMRHPAVVDERLVINAGLSRIYAHHMGGAEFVECYIVDIDAREL